MKSRELQEKYKEGNRKYLTIFGWLLIIYVVGSHILQIHFRAGQLLGDIFGAILGLFVEVFFNPISIIGICLVIMGNRKSPEKNHDKRGI